MDKLIKQEVIKFYISQILFLLVSVGCVCVPLFLNSILVSGYRVLIGLLLFAAIIIFEIIFMITWFYGYNANLPAKFCLESMPQAFFEMDDNLNKGYFSEGETRKCKERYTNTLNWLNRFVIFSKLFLIINILSLLVIVITVVLKQITSKQLCFPNYYGISAFFLILQISSMYISCKFLFKTTRSWIDRLHGIHKIKEKGTNNKNV